MGNKSPAMGVHCFIVPGQPSHFIEVRPTPWNDVVLAKKTCEIVDCCPESSNFNALLQQAIEFIKQAGFEYVQARVEHIREKRRLLENTGLFGDAYRLLADIANVAIIVAILAMAFIATADSDSKKAARATLARPYRLCTVTRPTHGPGHKAHHR